MWTRRGPDVLVSESAVISVMTKRTFETSWINTNGSTRRTTDLFLHVLDVDEHFKTRQRTEKEALSPTPACSGRLRSTEQNPSRTARLDLVWLSSRADLKMKNTSELPCSDMFRRGGHFVRQSRPPTFCWVFIRTLYEFLFSWTSSCLAERRLVLQLK